jgi:hypothetical protein
MSDYFARAAARAVPDPAPVRRAEPAFVGHVGMVEPSDDMAAATNLPEDPARSTEEPTVRPAVTRAESVPSAEQPLDQTGSGERWLVGEPPPGREPVLPTPVVEHSDLVAHSALVAHVDTDTGPVRPSEPAHDVLAFDRVAREPVVVAPRPETPPDPDVVTSSEAADRADAVPPPVAPLEPLALADAAIFDALGPPRERVAAVSPPAVAESRVDPEPARAGPTVVIDRLTVEIVEQTPAPDAPATRPRPGPSGLLAPAGRFDSRWGW